MLPDEKVNILLVDDQPAKLIAYEVILRDLGENLITASSATEALQQLLKNDVAVILVDVCMPELDGFDLVAMIREHPRFQQTAVIFISAILLAEADRIRGYRMGAVDYVPVPVIPEVLRAKVRIFVDLYRKTRQLELLNRDLEQRVVQRTAELEASTRRLLQSEERRSLALAAAKMGSWDWELSTRICIWDEGQCQIFGVDRATFVPRYDTVQPLVHAEDWAAVIEAFRNASPENDSFQAEIRIRRPDGEMRWCVLTSAGSFDAEGKLVRISGVTLDITDRKENEERQSLLAREVDHRARNMLAVVQAIVRLTHAETTQGYVAAIEGRIQALSQTHRLLSESRWSGADVRGLVNEELAPYHGTSPPRVTIGGPPVMLLPDKAQTLALTLHELATNAAKYGALSAPTGHVSVSWRLDAGMLALEWTESGGPAVRPPASQGFGTRIIHSSIRGQTGGAVTLDWRPEGLHCALSMAADAAVASPKERTRPPPPPVERTRAGVVLVAEDEALVGMMIRDILSQRGFAVAGPVASLDEAITVIEAHALDAAVLDVNMRGELAYPLAEALSARAIPFVFVTGYDHQSIAPSYRHVPVLQKPVNGDDITDALRRAAAAVRDSAKSGGESRRASTLG